MSLAKSDSITAHQLFTYSFATMRRVPLEGLLMLIRIAAIGDDLLLTFRLFTDAITLLKLLITKYLVSFELESKIQKWNSIQLLLVSSDFC